MQKPELCRLRQEGPLDQALRVGVTPPGPFPATALPMEQDQGDAMTQNLYPPFWKVLQILQVLEFQSQMAPVLLSGSVWTTSLDIAPREPIILPLCTALGPGEDYL